MTTQAASAAEDNEYPKPSAAPVSSSGPSTSNGDMVSSERPARGGRDQDSPSIRLDAPLSSLRSSPGGWGWGVAAVVAMVSAVGSSVFSVVAVATPTIADHHGLLTAVGLLLIPASFAATPFLLTLFRLRGVDPRRIASLERAGHPHSYRLWLGQIPSTKRQLRGATTGLQMSRRGYLSLDESHFHVWAVRKRTLNSIAAIPYSSVAGISTQLISNGGGMTYGFHVRTTLERLPVLDLVVSSTKLRVPASFTEDIASAIAMRARVRLDVPTPPA